MVDWLELLPELLDVVHDGLSLLNRLDFGVLCALTSYASFCGD
jgi:hypothetical protein